TVDLFKNFVRTSIYQVFISDFVIVEINNTREKDKKQNLLSVIEEYNLEFISLTPAELIFYGT
ncbi:MAG: hypothetical protein ICV53_12730, partial [Flavisolibacter sp.]|nr:hypothetical protein [Flavisolibacter sp.]